jgi:NTP pyrophosphatase (non-canonical NTP hydrolase)
MIPTCRFSGHPLERAQFSMAVRAPARHLTYQAAIRPLSGVSGNFDDAITDGERQMRLNDFHTANADRQHEAFAPPHTLIELVACVQEEAGELAAAVLGVTGAKKRKAHLTNEDVLDAVADLMTYASLVAGAVGCTDLESLLATTFNMVSTRAGSAFRVSP